MKKIKFFIALLILFFVSCISDVDFDQVNDIEIITPYLATLVYFNADSNFFLDDLQNEVLAISDTTEHPIFKGPYNEEYLVQADFNFKMSNSFDRDITVQILFLDEVDTTTYTFAPMYVSANNLNFESLQVINEASIPSVVSSEKIVISLLMGTGSNPLDSNSSMNLDFQSSVEFLYKITVDE